MTQSLPHAVRMPVLIDILAGHARALPGKPAIMSPDGIVRATYAELDRSAAGVAALLERAGCRPGDRLLLAVNNTPEFFAALFGAMRAGVVAVPVDANLALAELQRIVDHADPRAVVSDAASAPKLAELDLSGRSMFDAVALASDAVDAAAERLPGSADIDPAALALLLYTSGTTGQPKGVMHSAAGLAARLETIRRWFSLAPDDRALCLLPTHFGHGLICNCLATLGYGGTLVLCRPFDLDLVRRRWGYVEKNEVQWFSTVPTIVRLLLQAAERHPRAPTPALKFVTCASAPLRPEEVGAFERQFGVPLLNCYGITETASWTAFSPRAGERDASSVGTASGCRIRAVDGTGAPLPPGEAGELQVRGPSVMLGYYKNPALTDATIKDGWFSTGDYGRVDARDRVYILGRIKEIIIRAGLNIYPADVDAGLLAHPAIAEAYCVGLEDPMLGEKVAAVVVAKPGFSLGEREVIDHCRRMLAPYKCPEVVRFLEAVPKTSRGKVNRGALRQFFSSAF
jgi:long-chain acyl-CoA synthetase